jgi:hypothetical protein
MYTPYKHGMLCEIKTPRKRLSEITSICMFHHGLETLFLIYSVNVYITHILKCNHCLTSYDYKFTESSSHWFSENSAQSPLLFVYKSILPSEIIVLWNTAKSSENASSL